MTEAMQELKQMKIWFLYLLKPKPDGRLDKVPFSALGGVTGTSQKYSGTWVSYKEAKAALAKHDDNKNVGLGFKIPPGFFFYDIDDRDLSLPYVAQRLERFNSYAERSVSGRDIHIYGKYDLEKIPQYIDRNGKLRLDRKFYMKHPENKTELYFGELTNRFAAFTGDVVCDKPLKDCTDALLLTLDRDMRRKPQKRLGKDESDERELFDIVCSLRKQKNGAKFKALYDDGDISGYASQSEADAALCALLAFRAGDDPELIDRLFRKSALTRDKWEREDYRESTIRLGIEACKGEFHRSVMPHPSFIKFDERSFMPQVSVPLLARYIREHLDYILVRDRSTGSIMKYVYQNGCYRFFTDDMMRGIIKSFIVDYDEELVRMGQVNECLQHLSTDLKTYTADDLNVNEDIINFENGILRLSDMTLLPHSADVLSSIQIPCQWTGRLSSTPIFDSYMHTLTSGEEEITTLLLEFIGACLSNVKGWRMKKALFMLGYRNIDGKITVVPEEAKIVQRIYNEYLTGDGLTIIANRLNEEGVTTQSGCLFHKSAIGRILRNYTYTGDLILQTKYRENHLTKRTRVNKGELPRYHVKSSHEAIIPLETFEAAQAEIMRRKAKYAPKTKAGKYALSGKIKCEICGKNYRRKTTKSNIIWICSTYNSKGKKYCNSKAMPEQMLNELVRNVGDFDFLIAAPDNLVHFHLKNGTTITKTWQDRSRSKSWTPAMKEKARQQTLGRIKK